jgi:argininosuccinate lyase
MLCDERGSMGTKKPWGGRFHKETDTTVELFTSSLSFDRRLYKHDIAGSIAHCRMLAKQKIITVKDSRIIVRGLKEIEQEIERGDLAFAAEFEDIHMLIESRLIEKVGSVGGKLHTARSRNDQVALDMSLFLRDVIVSVVHLIDRVQHALLSLADKHRDVLMPGFTHLQHAQPVLFSHHMMAYFEMFKRDRQRMEDCFARTNRMPLGAGAMAGTPHPVDREYVAQLLGYPAVTANSMDSVSDRDTFIEFCSNAAIIMMHLSRFCEELIVWSSAEFQFVEISDSFCTGSSIMPQKKNPDVAELIRGKTGRTYGNLVSLLTIMKSLPLAYNRDLQEDKEALFDTVDTLEQSLGIFSLLLPELKINARKMYQAAQEGFLTATDLADYLVEKGVPFRTAHEVVGSIVAFCIREKKDLTELSLDDLRRFSPVFDNKALQCVTLEASINSRKSTGGTGGQQVKKAIRKARGELKKGKLFFEKAKGASK